MNSFTVWYVWIVIAATPKGMENDMGISKDYPECVQTAARAMARYSEGTTKWACHEMTIGVDDVNVYVKFPQN